jgi:hypothetical protein
MSENSRFSDHLENKAKSCGFSLSMVEDGEQREYISLSHIDLDERIILCSEEEAMAFFNGWTTGHKHQADLNMRAESVSPKTELTVYNIVKARSDAFVIDAVKILREWLGIGLKEAKEVFDTGMVYVYNDAKFASYSAWLLNRGWRLEKQYDDV